YPGTIQAPPDIAALVRASDLVVQGEVTGVQDEGAVTYLVGDVPVTFGRRLASVAPSRTLRGAAPDDAVEVEFLASPAPSTPTAPSSATSWAGRSSTRTAAGSSSPSRPPSSPSTPPTAPSTRSCT